MTHPMLSPEVAHQHRQDLVHDAEAHRRTHVPPEPPSPACDDHNRQPAPTRSRLQAFFHLAATRH